MPASETSGLDRIRAHYLARARKGQILNTKELLSYASKAGLPGHTEDEIRKLKEDWKFSAMYQRVTRPKEFVATESYRYGVCQIDLGFMDKISKPFNKDCWGFVVCVEVTSLQVAIEPVVDKSAESWNRALTHIVQTSSINKISTLISDRERALTSQSTIDLLKRDFGIRMVFLRARKKAYYAELFVSIIKRMLGMSLRYARKRKDDDAANWIKYLKPIADHLNSRNVPGTNFKRKAVNEFNYIQMLNQKLGGEAYARMNQYRLPGRSLRAGWGDKLFKFKLSDRVLVDRRALVGKKKRKAFSKTSVIGGFSSTVHVVVGRRLRASRSGRYVPVYKLRKENNKNPEEEMFYQTDLQKLSEYQKEHESDSPPEED